LRTMPGVADVAVIGIPHERSGEAPRAYVVKREGFDLDEAQVAQFVAKNAAPYKHLVGGVEFVDVIPKSNYQTLERFYAKSSKLLTKFIKCR
jgi:4-coumarate--CoA ligase